MEAQFLGETRTEFDGTEPHSKVLYTAKIVQCVINDIFDAPSTVEASFIMTPGLAMDLLAPSETPGASPSEGGRALYIAVRNRAGRMQTFIITDSKIVPKENGLAEVTVTGADPRIWLQNSPSIHGETGGLYTGTLTEQLQRLTAAYTHISWPGKREWQKKPVMPYDPNWLPNAEQRVRGFIQGSTLETGNALQLETPFPQPVWDAIQALGPAFHEDYTLFPMEIYEAPSQPMWQWVLRERVQTQDVLSDISGTLKTESISMSNIGAETQNYRSDSNTTVVYSSGNSQVLGEPGYRGAWAMMDFQSVQVPDESPKSFVPAPIVRRRLGITGKAGLSHYVEPGSFARIRIDDRVVPVYLNEVFSYFGSRDWSLGAVYTEVKYWPGANVPDYSPEETVLKIKSSYQTLNFPFNQAPAPQGGVKVTLMREDGTVLAQKTFFGTAASATFTNVISITNPDQVNEWTLRIRYSMGGDSTAFGKALFGSMNVYDGSLFSNNSNALSQVTEVVQIPLQGYLRFAPEGSGNFECYTARLFSAFRIPSPIFPEYETWGGWNENDEVRGLLWARLGAYEPTSSATLLGVHHEMMLSKGNYGSMKPASWEKITTLGHGAYTRAWSRSAAAADPSGNPIFPKLTSVRTLLRGNSSLQEGLFYEAFAVRGFSTSSPDFKISLPQLSQPENGILERTFVGISFTPNQPSTAKFEVDAPQRVGNGFMSGFLGDTENGNFRSPSITVTINGLRECGNRAFYSFYRRFPSSTAGTYTFSFKGLSSLTKAGADFMRGALYFGTWSTTTVTLGIDPFTSLSEVGNSFMQSAVYKSGVGAIYMPAPAFPSLRIAGDSFFKNLGNNEGSQAVSFNTGKPNFQSLTEVGDDFFFNARAVTYQSPDLDGEKMSFPALTKVGKNFMNEQSLTHAYGFSFANLEEADDNFGSGLSGGSLSPKSVSLPSLKKAGDRFFFASTYYLTWNRLDLPELEELGDEAFARTGTSSPSNTLLTAIAPEIPSIKKIGKNFMKYAFHHAGRPTPFVEPEWLELTDADPEGFMEGIYRDATALQGNLQVISPNRYMWFNPDASGAALTGSQNWAKASAVPAGSSVKYTEGTPIAIPASGTTEEGIPANFLT